MDSKLVDKHDVTFFLSVVPNTLLVSLVNLPVRPPSWTRRTADHPPSQRLPPCTLLHHDVPTSSPTVPVAPSGGLFFVSLSMCPVTRHTSPDVFLRYHLFPSFPFAFLPPSVSCAAIYLLLPSRLHNTCADRRFFSHHCRLPSSACVGLLLYVSFLPLTIPPAFNSIRNRRQQPRRVVSGPILGSLGQERHSVHERYPCPDPGPSGFRCCHVESLLLHLPDHAVALRRNCHHRRHIPFQYHQFGIHEEPHLLVRFIFSFSRLKSSLIVELVLSGKMSTHSGGRSAVSVFLVFIWLSSLRRLSHTLCTPSILHPRSSRTLPRGSF